MKNYYLKRIDELRTDIGSDSRPTPVATVSRIAAGATYPALKKGAQLATKAKQALKLPFEGLKGDVKDALQKRLEKLKRKKNNPQRVARLKAAEQGRLKAAEEKKAREQAAMEVQRTAMDDFGRPRQENSSTAYLQIGYILAESLGLL